MIRYPELAAEPGAISGARTLPYVSGTRYAARQQQSRRLVDQPTDRRRRGPAHRDRRGDPMTAASAAAVITDPTDLTPQLLAAVTEHSERRARALIADGMDEDAAIAQATDDAVLVVRRTAQLARRASALVELVDAYHSSSYRLLRDLGEAGAGARVRRLHPFRIDHIPPDRP